ncbi:MAG: phage terminase small subunit P27 family [Verrucomicrobiae bacterium]|nr:phage terminase small subunit P27 family [Verrucomicrobiae bacterium]
MSGPRGPRPLPQPILDARGSRNAHSRPGYEGVTCVAPGLPEAPEWLAEYDSAVLVWNRVVPQLQEMGVVGSIDEGSLARYCYCWAQWHAVRTALKGASSRVIPIRDKNGNVVSLKRNPLARDEKELMDEMRRLEAEFGMTPSSRTRLQVKANLDSSARTVASKSNPPPDSKEGRKTRFLR